MESSQGMDDAALINILDGGGMMELEVIGRGIKISFLKHDSNIF